MEQNNQDEKSLLKFLKKVSIFKDLSNQDRKHLQQFLYTRQYKAGEEVFQKNYPNVIFYIVQSGELQVYINEKDKEVELSRTKPGGHFGSFGLFADVKRTASVRALEDSVLLGISKKDLATFVHRFPLAGVKILYELGKIMCEHIIQLNERLVKS